MPTTPEAVEKLKQAPAVDGVEPLILRRWSPRAFADRAVSPQNLKALFEAARWAASSYNEQPWRFVVGRRGDEAYQKIFDSLVEFNQGWAKSAPVLLASFASKNFSHNSTPNRHALHDTGAATATLAIEATALGLHAHSMAGFDAEKLRSAFHVPADFEAGAVTAVGYLGDPNSLPEGLLKQETSPRQRKPLEEIVFSAWGTPARF